MALLSLWPTVFITKSLAHTEINPDVIQLLPWFKAIMAFFLGLFGVVIAICALANIFFSGRKEEKQKLNDLSARQKISNLITTHEVLSAIEKGGHIILKCEDADDVIHTIALPIWARKEKKSLETKLFSLNTNTLYTKFDTNNEDVSMWGVKGELADMRTVNITMEKVQRISKQFQVTDEQYKMLEDGNNPFQDEMETEIDAGDVKFDYAAEDNDGNELKAWR